MITGLQAGSGEPLGEPWLTELVQTDVDMLRLEAQNPQPHNAPVRASRETVHAIINEVTGLFNPLLIIRYSDQVADLPAGPFYVEVGNEPDLEHFGWTPEGYITACREVRDALDGLDYRIFIGAISSRDIERNFRFLRNIPWKEFPNSIGCTYHRYPVAGRPPQVGQYKPWFGGRKSREWEVDEIRKIVGKDRPIAVSEVGYHELDYTEAQATEYFGWEREFLEKTGHEFAVAYTAWDGPQSSKDYLGHFGFRDLETGRWKNQTRVWCGSRA